LPFVYLQTLIRLKEELQEKLVTNIEALRTAYPGSGPSSVGDKEDPKRRGSTSGPFTIGGVSDAFADSTYSVTAPLTREALDLMDAPIPSGVLAEEFAYHGLAPSYLRAMHQAHELLDQICTELHKCFH
jgi:hypothetical protein